jgi:hypothetical protein
MPTFSSILRSFPRPEERQAGVARYLGVFVTVCIVVSLMLSGAGFYWRRSALIDIAFLPLCLMVVGMWVDLFVEVKGSKPFLKNPGAWLAERLDNRFAQEKHVAARLVATDLNELRQMRTRLEAELIRVERWLDVLKPLSMFAPAVLIVVTAGVFRLPDLVQDICKVFVAAATIGAVAAAIAIYQGLIRLRILSSTLHYAIELAEENRKPSFRKVSRKRGQPA